MSYSEVEIKVLKERLDIYESTLNSILERFNQLEIDSSRKKTRKKVVKRDKDDCIIHLSFSGLNKAMSLKDKD